MALTPYFFFCFFYTIAPLFSSFYADNAHFEIFSISILFSLFVGSHTLWYPALSFLIFPSLPPHTYESLTEALNSIKALVLIFNPLPIDGCLCRRRGGEHSVVLRFSLCGHKCYHFRHLSIRLFIPIPLLIIPHHCNPSSISCLLFSLSVKLTITRLVPESCSESMWLDGVTHLPVIFSYPLLEIWNHVTCCSFSPATPPSYTQMDSEKENHFLQLFKSSLDRLGCSWKRVFLQSRGQTHSRAKEKKNCGGRRRKSSRMSEYLLTTLSTFFLSFFPRLHLHHLNTAQNNGGCV